MIPNPPGPTSGYARRRTTLSIGKPSTKRKPWDTRFLPGVSFRVNSTLRCPWSHTPTTQKAKQLLQEAGYPNGFDAGECSGDSVYAGVMEAAVNDLAAVGIRARVRPIERAAAFAAHHEKTFKNLAFQGSGALAMPPRDSTPLPTAKGRNRGFKTLKSMSGTCSRPRSATARNARPCCTRFSGKLYDEARVMPIWELSFLCASGPRAAVSG